MTKNITILILLISLLSLWIWQDRKCDYLVIENIAEKQYSKELMKIIKNYEERLNECLMIKNDIKKIIGG